MGARQAPSVGRDKVLRLGQACPAASKNLDSTTHSLASICNKATNPMLAIFS